MLLLIASQDGKTALTYAVKYGYLGVIKALLQANADANLQDKVSDTW